MQKRISSGSTAERHEYKPVLRRRAYSREADETELRRIKQLNKAKENYAACVIQEYWKAHRAKRALRSEVPVKRRIEIGIEHPRVVSGGFLVSSEEERDEEHDEKRDAGDEPEEYESSRPCSMLFHSQHLLNQRAAEQQPEGVVEENPVPVAPPAGGDEAEEVAASYFSGLGGAGARPKLIEFSPRGEALLRQLTQSTENVWRQYAELLGAQRLNATLVALSQLVHSTQEDALEH